MRLIGFWALLLSVSSMGATLQVSESQLMWYGEKIAGYHYGEIQLLSGQLDLQGGGLKGGRFVVDMDKMTCGDCDPKTAERLLAHLKSEDFFSVAKNKTAILKIKTVLPWSQIDQKKQSSLWEAVKVANGREFFGIKLENPTHLIVADLSIKGKTHSQDIVAQLSVSGGSVAANGLMVVDRTKYDVRYGSKRFFDNLGNRIVSDLFEVGFKLKAR